jgi:hypothetical protein
VAKDWEDYLDEDECCLNCGEIDFQPSKTPGVCLDCMADLTAGFKEELDAIDEQNDFKLNGDTSLEVASGLRLPTLYEIRNHIV